MKNEMKQTEIGKIPVDWEVVALRDIAQRVKSKNTGGKHEVLTISAKVGFIRQEDKYNRYMAGKSVENYTLLKQGQFSYNKGNSLTYPFGCIYRLDDYDRALVPNVYISFELNHLVDTDFCRHLFLEGEFINRLKPFITSGVRGNGLLNVSAEDFFSLSLAIPPLPEQRKIAEVLSTLDEKMTVIDEQLTQTQELKKGLMRRLLTKGIGHTQFKNSSLGEIPVSWEIRLLDEVTKRGSGHTPSKKFSEYYNGGIKWISLADSAKLDNGWIKETKTEISSLGIKNSSAILHPKGTVLLSRDAGIGKSAVMHENMAVSQHFITWTCNGKINNWFLYYYLQFNKSLFERVAAGSTIKTIGLPFFKQLVIPIPALMEQLKIVDVLSTIDEKINTLQKRRSQYIYLKKGLLQQLLTGKRRVLNLQPA